MTSLPYSDIFYELLVSIHRALNHCRTVYLNGDSLEESDPYLAGIFLPFYEKYSTSGINKHLSGGFTPTTQMRAKKFPRLSKLVIYHYLQSQEFKNKSSSYKAEIIPSPLLILYQALTVPDEPQTAAYPFVLCRSMLFYFLNIHPRHPDFERYKIKMDEFREDDVLKSINSFNNYVKQQARWPDKRLQYKSISTRINYLIGHLLSLKGITYLWFPDEKQLVKFLEIPNDGNTEETIRDIYANSKSAEQKVSFRLAGQYTDLPDSSEIINWIFGFPLPVRGADILFYGGVKKAVNSGLVMALHGQPGAGKTSTALTLAAVLSPLKTKTVYLTLEEDPADLETRLYTLIPEYLRALSVYENNYAVQKKKQTGTSEYFTAFKIRGNVDFKQFTGILQILKKDLEIKFTENVEISTEIFQIPAVCPLLIVIDNVNEMLYNVAQESTKYSEIEDFIEQCRNMGAIVVLISGDDTTARFKLDYLVDVAIYLRQEGLKNRHEKPIRILELVKTRHQISRQGSHVFHLSNSRGFRISPQVPSQMDKREKLKVELPSLDNFIETLNLMSSKSGYRYVPYLSIAENSQILIHGYGSSGKAGFGMKLLLTPELFNIAELEKESTEGPKGEDKSKQQKGIRIKRKVKKVLIISFLYPEDYYEVLRLRLIKQFSLNFSGYDENNSKVYVKAFYPGFLSPEDFVYKIVRLLDEAKLEGEPFTGILLDGLHNIFLQFKSLQEAHMVWPLLYSLLSRYTLTVVSTFTNFSLNERHTNSSGKESLQAFQTPDDFILMQQGQKPFLHGLVKAADYYFLLEEIVDDQNNYQKDYWLIVKSSIRNIPPKDGLKWDREKLTITNSVSAQRIYNGSGEHTDSSNFPA